MTLRCALLAFLVSFCAAGCGLTEWQRTQDRLWGSFEDSRSAELTAQVAAAHPGIPREPHGVN